MTFVPWLRQVRLSGSLHCSSYKGGEPGFIALISIRSYGPRQGTELRNASGECVVGGYLEELVDEVV